MKLLQVGQPNSLVGAVSEKQRLARAEQTVQGAVSLAGLRSGQKGRIVGIETGEARKLQKLMAMGILPGKKLKLIQTFPSHVFTVGFSQFAVDADLARSIYVLPHS